MAEKIVGCCDEPTDEVMQTITNMLESGLMVARNADIPAWQAQIDAAYQWWGQFVRGLTEARRRVK